MNATIKDVADLAGVSVATVSKFINGGNLREGYRVRVDKAVKELNYSVNEVARNLKTNRTNMIGVLAPDITSSFIPEIITLIQRELLNHGYIPIILDYQKSQEIEWKHLDVLTRMKVDGIILFPGFNETALCHKIEELNIPYVLVDNIVVGANTDVVVSNNYESAYAMTEKLIEAGHKRIGLCRGTEGTYSAEERKRGYEDAMRKHALPFIEEQGFYTIEGGYEATKRLIEMTDCPTAILSCNYHMTIGALRVLSEKKMKIGRDISFAAFDKQEFDFVFEKPISCVIQPEEKIAIFAANLILKKVQNLDVKEPKVHLHQADLFITDSIRKA